MNALEKYKIYLLEISPTALEAEKNKLLFKIEESKNESISLQNTERDKAIELRWLSETFEMKLKAVNSRIQDFV